MVVKERGINTIVLVVVVLALAAGYYMWTHPTPQGDIQQAQVKIEKLNHSLDSLAKLHVISDSALVKYRDQIDTKNVEIAASKQQIANIKRYYETKIRSITAMSTTELDSFFTARYGQ